MGKIDLREKAQAVRRRGEISAGGFKCLKLFQNLRATRQVELCQEFPEHVVCSWIGNSPSVVREHYLRTTEEHFQQAVNPEQEEATGSAAQNAAQYDAEWGRKERKDTSEDE